MALTEQDPERARLPDVPGYELLCELGRGGMGVVYKAREVDTGRILALKMILAARDADFFELARFRIEAEAVACMQHPNVIRIHRVGVHDGYPYFALEYAERGSLESMISGRPQLPRLAVMIVKDLAMAIQQAHDRGIVHRDLKPANVLIMADGTPKLSDFGLAKFLLPLRSVADLHQTISTSHLDVVLLRYRQRLSAQWSESRARILEEYKNLAEGSTLSEEQYFIRRTAREFGGIGGDAGEAIEERVRVFASEVARGTVAEPREGDLSPLDELTHAGTILGTPAYMSPEQASGAVAGPPSDVYALGALFYYILSGRPPSRGARDPFRREIPWDAPAPIEPRVNRELEAVCLKCLAYEPAERYPRAAELAGDLQRFLDGYATSAATDGAHTPVPPPEEPMATRSIEDRPDVPAPRREIPVTVATPAHSPQGSRAGWSSWRRFWTR